MSAVHLKTVLQTHSAPLTEVWPPYATDLTDKAAKIPVDLFNTMAYITGLATEPIFDEYVDIKNESLEKKLVSVCQDIVFLSSRGEKQHRNMLHWQ